MNTQTTTITKKTGQFRIGKTKRDREAGAQARNRANKMERADWSNDSKRTNQKGSFPYHTCNGKRNRVVR